MGSPKEEETQTPPPVDDMTDKQLGAIIRESITVSELTLRGSIQMAEIPLEEEVIDGIVGLVTEVWRTKEIKELYPLAKEVDAAENPGSRTFEVQLDREYLKATNQDHKDRREAVDDLKSRVVEHLTPIRVPKLPMTMRSYTTSAMAVLVKKKKSEKITRAKLTGGYL